MPEFHSEREILADIEKLIQTHFGETGRGIHAEVKGDKVTLWGTVDTLAEKEFIANRINRIDGVRELDNSLTVANDGEIDDKDIEQGILERFSRSKHEGIMGLGCRVSRGVVTLLGHVEAQSAERLAKKLASQVRGVKEIRSEIQLTVKGLDDATLVNRVEAALAASPWVDAKEVRTSAEAGVVTLHGFVDTQEEIEWLVDTAYQVPGVKAVVSEITARHHSRGSDMWLTEQLVAKLGQNHLNSAQVRAAVIDGIAFLTGEVYSDEDRERAESLVHKIPGIRAVNNSIKVAAHSSH